MATRFHTPAVRVNTGVRRAFHGDLPRWYRRYHRKLPWRSTRDPYRIWVSEIMLQQTRVETVRPYYARWLRAFPTIQSLAPRLGRPCPEIVGRSRLLLARTESPRAAQAVVREHGGQLPRTAEGLRALPGIGRYTAGAIASIAFGERTPLVDGNVARVFARVFAIRANVKSPRTLQSLWKLAEDLLPEHQPGRLQPGVDGTRRTGVHTRHSALRRVSNAPGLRGAGARTGRGTPEPRRQTPHRASRGQSCVREEWEPDSAETAAPSGLLANFWELPPADARRFRVGHRIHELRHTITHRRIVFRGVRVRPDRETPIKQRVAMGDRLTTEGLGVARGARCAIESVLFSAEVARDCRSRAGV